MNLCPPDCPCLLHPLCIIWWKPGCPYVALFVCHSHRASDHIPLLECVYASVLEFKFSWMSISAPLPMHSLMKTWVPLYFSVFVSQSSHFCSHTLFRMYICIAYVFMSIWLPILAWAPLHGYIETWVPLCNTVCVCVYHSLHFWYHTLFRMCTCISTCTYVYLTPHVCFITLAYLYGNMGSSVWHCECVAIFPLLIPHLG